MDLIEKEVKGRRVLLREGEKNAPLVLLATSQKGLLQLPEILQLADEGLQGRSYHFAAFCCDSWDDDYSPWAAEAISGENSFSGKGTDTLAWISEALIADLRRFLFFDDIFIVGYSLAGLFSLWAVYESHLFSGCGCCSGSLWFSGWESYANAHQLLRQGRVYLSLGGKEEKSSDPIMATIGAVTRRQATLLAKDSSVTASKLEMNPGGHFSANEKRLAKAIVWLLSGNKM
ncbi:MAG: alpha/beta hydrolase [Firmicutes bacterium]|nr:alpha/beta hydrolase [Bacillota bacterium]